MSLCDNSCGELLLRPNLDSPYRDSRSSNGYANVLLLKHLAFSQPRIQQLESTHLSAGKTIYRLVAKSTLSTATTLETLSRSKSEGTFEEGSTFERIDLLSTEYPTLLTRGTRHSSYSFSQYPRTYDNGHNIERKNKKKRTKIILYKFEKMAPNTTNGNGNDSLIPIAICGVGIRFPAGIRNAEQFWESIANDRGQSRVIGEEEEELNTVDASIFSLTEAEAESCSPLQRKLLEVTRECLEDACEVNYWGEDARVGCYAGGIGEDEASMVSLTHGLKGPRFVYYHSCYFFPSCVECIVD